MQYAMHIYQATKATLTVQGTMVRSDVCNSWWLSLGIFSSSKVWIEAGVADRIFRSLPVVVECQD